MEINLSLNMILDRIDYGRFEGTVGVQNITGIATIDDAVEGELTFVSSSKYIERLAKSKASIVIIRDNIEAEPRPGQLFLYVENPSIEMAKVCETIAQKMWPSPEPGINRNTSISTSARIDDSASIGPFVTIEDDVEIGPNCVIESGCFVGKECRLDEGCWLAPNVTLCRDSRLGKRVRIHSSTVIGSDGFGYEFQDGVHKKVPQVGSVIIGDDVEIGVNTSIDRGRFGATKIGEGTKIDNLVLIGHNADIGKHCILCGQVALAGSTNLGDFVVMGGRAGTSGHLSIGSGAQMAGECVAYSDLDGSAKYGGSPAVSLVAYQRITVLKRRLPDLFNRLQRIESQMREV